jgi:hypothetical protein
VQLNEIIRFRSLKDVSFVEYVGFFFFLGTCFTLRFIANGDLGGMGFVSEQSNEQFFHRRRGKETRHPDKWAHLTKSHIV